MIFEKSQNVWFQALKPSKVSIIEETTQNIETIDSFDVISVQ